MKTLPVDIGTVRALVEEATMKGFTPFAVHEAAKAVAKHDVEEKVLAFVR